MPPFTKEILFKAAKAGGFRPEFFEKASRLLGYLDVVAGHVHLGPRLALRGGTAINLFLADAPRVSVDADLCYIGAEDREGMEKERPTIEKTLRTVGESEGYEVRDISKSYASESFHLRYENVYGRPDSIKVDTNYLNRLPLFPTVRERAVTLIEGLSCAFPLFSRSEIYASKVKALVERGAARDLYDVYRLLETRELPGKPSLNHLITFFLTEIEGDTRTLAVDRISWPNRRDLGNAVLPLLRDGNVPTPEDLKKAVEPYVASVLSFDERQKSFLDALMAGEGKGELLFPDDADLAGRISRHPALRWKIQGIRRAASSEI